MGGSGYLLKVQKSLSNGAAIEINCYNGRLRVRMKLLRKRCFLERLESRVLFAGSPLVLSGGTGNNTFYLRRDASAAQLDVWINATSPGSGTPTQTHLMSAITTVTINGDGVNDSLTVDFSNGNPFPSTVSYTGGSGITNTMTVTGLGGTAVTINGSAVTFGSTPINYSDTQFITINGNSSNDVLTQAAQPNASVTFNGGGGNDTLNINGGTYLLNGDPAATTTNLTVNDNSSLFFASASAGTGINARHLAALNLGAGATAAVNSPVSSGDRAVVVLGSLSINSTAQLDLGGNDLIVHNGNLATISGWITTGYSAGTWSGDGLTSSAAHLDSRHLMALGILLNSNGSTAIDATFDGQSAVSTDVLVKYTFYGDADLSGTIDGGDYSLIDNGFNTHSSGWFNGGFNYTGTTNGDDYLLIDNAFNSQSSPVDPLDTKLENALNVAQLQLQKTVAAVGTSSNYPQYTNANGTWSWVPATQWTAGFFPGSLWQLYAATGNPYYKTEATQFTNPLSVDKSDTSDVGFQVYDSFDPLLLQNPTNASSIVQIMLTAAASKATQFNSTVGAFEAWRASTSGNPLANFNVLMDLIMDSNLLYWAAKQSGNQTYYNEALSNATIEENYLGSRRRRIGPIRLLQFSQRPIHRQRNLRRIQVPPPAPGRAAKRGESTALR